MPTPHTQSQPKGGGQQSGVPPLPPAPWAMPPPEPGDPSGSVLPGQAPSFTGQSGVSFGGGNIPDAQLNIGIGPESLAPLPSVGDFGDERDQIQQATMDRLYNSLDPVYQQQFAALQQRLANQGLAQDSPAYIAEMERFDRSFNEALENLALQSLVAGSGEQQRLFEQAMGLRGQTAGEQLGLGQLQVGMAGASSQFASAAAQQQIAQQQLALQALNDQWARDMQGRQQYFNEMAFFGGGPGQPMLGIPSAAPIDPYGAYNVYNQGNANLINNYGNSLQGWDMQAGAAAQPYNNMAMILSGLFGAAGGGFF